MDLQVAQLTETERANIEITKHALAQVAAQKTLNKAKQKEAELTAKVIEQINCKIIHCRIWLIFSINNISFNLKGGYIGMKLKYRFY